MMEIVKESAQRFKALSPAERERYSKLALAEKVRYEAEMKEYIAKQANESAQDGDKEEQEEDDNEGTDEDEEEDEEL